MKNQGLIIAGVVVTGAIVTALIIWKSTQDATKQAAASTAGVSGVNALAGQLSNALSAIGIHEG